MIGGVVGRVSSPVLAGRDAEVAQLRAALQRAAAGQPAIVVVAGEAGIGKTRLMTELLGQAGGLGAVALSGGCLDIGDGVLAYAPMVEALRPLVDLLDPSELERVLGGARAELARLVPELGGQAMGRQAVTPLAPTRLFELLLGVLHRLTDQGPVLVVVEDLHWADQSTRDLLGFLVRNLRGGVALVLTYRADELHRRHPLRPFLAELDRGGRVERLELGRLGRRELGELLAGILGKRAPAALVGELLARSEGNPFFAEELVWRLREAVTHHVLAVDEASGGYVFRHALVQEAIYDDLLPVQRGPLHAAYARALERRIEQRGDASDTASGAAVEWGQLAYHWYAAHDLGRRWWSACRPGRPPSRSSRWPRPSGTTSVPWSCGTRSPSRPPPARWTGARCSIAPPRRPTWPATTTVRSPWPAWPSTGSTRSPSHCGPGRCWSGCPATTTPPATLPGRWPPSSGRWP
jgi:predicted ATPase